jgi:hypothetical protein
MRRFVASVSVVLASAVTACGGSSTSPSDLPSSVVASIASFSGKAPLVTAEQYPTPHPYPSLHVTVQWPDSVSGLNGQVVLTIFDRSGAIIGRTHVTGRLPKAGSVPYSMGIATYTPAPFRGTVVVRLSKTACGSGCTPANDLCAPGGLRGFPNCNALPELPGPILSEVTGSVTFGTISERPRNSSH